MSDYRGQCVACGQEVRGSAVRELVCAWEAERSQGGANKVQGPGKRYSGRVMHPACHETLLMRERSGLARGQGALL